MTQPPARRIRHPLALKKKRSPVDWRLSWRLEHQNSRRLRRAGQPVALQADAWQPLRCWRTAGLDKELVGESTSRRQGLRFERGRRAGTGVGHGGHHSIEEQPKTGASLGLNEIHRPTSGRKPFPTHENFPPRRNKVRKARQALHGFCSHSRNHEMDSLKSFTTKLRRSSLSKKFWRRQHSYFVSGKSTSNLYRYRIRKHILCMVAPARLRTERLESTNELQQLLISYFAILLLKK